jgi:ketosteroid isomerase-like protein
MQRRMLLAGLAAGLLPLKARARSQDEQEIRALLERLAGAFQAKNVDQIMACFIPGESLLVFDVWDQYQGAAAVRKALEEHFAAIQGPLEFVLSDVSITSSASLAYAHMIEHQGATTKSGKTMRLIVRNTRALRKVKGQGLIAHEHVSLPVDRATGRAEFLSAH